MPRLSTRRRITRITRRQSKKMIHRLENSILGCLRKLKRAVYHDLNHKDLMAIECAHPIPICQNKDLHDESSAPAHAISDKIVQTALHCDLTSNAVKQCKSALRMKNQTPIMMEYPARGSSSNPTINSHKHQTQHSLYTNECSQSGVYKNCRQTPLAYSESVSSANISDNSIRNSASVNSVDVSDFSQILKKEIKE